MVDRLREDSEGCLTLNFTSSNRYASSTLTPGDSVHDENGVGYYVAATFPTESIVIGVSEIGPNRSACFLRPLTMDEMLHHRYYVAFSIVIVV